MSAKYQALARAATLRALRIYAADALADVAPALRKRQPQRIKSDCPQEGWKWDTETHYRDQQEAEAADKAGLAEFAEKLRALPDDCDLLAAAKLASDAAFAARTMTVPGAITGANWWRHGGTRSADWAANVAAGAAKRVATVGSMTDAMEILDAVADYDWFRRPAGYAEERAFQAADMKRLGLTATVTPA